MPTVTVNVSFPTSLLKRITVVAHQEARSRSELLRDAVRLYIERKQRWARLTAFWRHEARRRGLKPHDVDTSIAAYRRRRHSP